MSNRSEVLRLRELRGCHEARQRVAAIEPEPFPEEVELICAEQALLIADADVCAPDVVRDEWVTVVGHVEDDGGLAPEVDIEADDTDDVAPGPNSRCRSPKGSGIN